ncbi:MAG: glycoside hydrolase family 127 protein, partial [Verrucomicrobiae bacterium]|nr:glycoside hydrolase family 127 protein [Verrucomicrobiae bacterium]
MNSQLMHVACALLGVGLSVATAAPTRVQQPLTVNEVPALRGYVGERWEANRAHYLHDFDIDHYVRLVEARSHRDWWWLGEQDGKWLESAVLSSAHSDPELRKKAKEMLDRIIASQEPGGYVGVTSKAFREERKVPLRGMDAYELYFKLHGLIAAWEQWGDQRALDSAAKLGDYFVSTIAPGKAEFWPSDLRPPANHEKTLTGESAIAGHSVHYSLEGTMLIDPMLRLALATKDKRYLNWSKWVVENIDRWSGWDTFSKLDKVADGTMGIHEVQPYVHSHTFHMNFLGFLRLYEITGDPSYLRKVAGAWKDIASRQMYITGGVSVGEHYEAGHVKPVTGHVVETCATMSWLQVTQYLLELTGEVKYADAMERLLWNHVFAAQAIDGDTYRYHTAPNGVKPEGYYHGTDCCTGSGHRMISLLPTFLYGKDEKGVFINQYVASTADVKLSGGRTMRLRQETSYPEDSRVRISVEAAPEGTSAIHLRLPAWCASPGVKLNGETVETSKPGSYLTIERQWKTGDTIELGFPMELKWVRSDSPWRTIIHRLPGGEIMHKPVDGDTPPWALTRGPVVYAADTVWWNDSKQSAPDQIGEDLAIVPDLKKVHPIDKPGKLVGPVYEAEFVRPDGEALHVPMVPFTNIGQWYRPGSPKPDKNSAAYSYAIWFVDRKAPAFQEKMRVAGEQRELLARAIDHVIVGDPASESSHEVEGGIAAEYNG